MLINALQPTHLIIVLVVALLILGPKRLPDAGRALGQGIKEFKHSISATDDADALVPIRPTSAAEPDQRVSSPAARRSIDCSDRG
jgi:sec-independent protein translocase protein TatA